MHEIVSQILYFEGFKLLIHRRSRLHTLILCFEYQQERDSAHRHTADNGGQGPGAVVQTPLWPSSFKETKCFSLLTRKDSIVWGASVTER